MLGSQRARDNALSNKLGELQTLRKETEKEVMFDGKDPSDYVCAQLRTHCNESESEVKELRAKHQKSLWQKIRNRVPSKTDSGHNEHRIASAKIKRTKHAYEVSSQTRKSLNQITTIAFMKSPPLCPSTYSKIAATKWDVNFELLAMPDLTIWDVLGYDNAEFQSWWTVRQGASQLKAPAGREWQDMTALYGGIVCLLDYLKLPEWRRTVLYENCNNLHERVRQIAIKLEQAMNFPEHFSSTSNFFGFFATFVHIALSCLGSVLTSFSEQQQSGIGDLQLTADYYERQIICLEILADVLIDKSEDLPRARRQTVLKTIPEAASEHSEPSEIDSERALMYLNSLPAFDSEVLERLGLKEIVLSPIKGSPIGFGSSAVVYEWFTPEAQACFAVKEPTANSGLSHNAIWNRVGREALIWSRLQHDNILPLRGFYISPDNLPALVTDKCNWNFRQFIVQCSPITQKTRLELLYDVVSGLAYLHSKSIAHGDLRANNVLIKEDKDKPGHTAVLIDFGVSYFVEKESVPQMTGSIFQTTHRQVGNPNWLSPELLRKADSRDNMSDRDCICISKAGDIYAFGCVFLEVIYERDPYQSFQSEEEKRARKLQGALPATISETSAAFYPFLCSLWAPEPADRPSAESVLGMMDDFLRVLRE